MRKVFLWAMLVLVLVWAGIAGADDEPEVPTLYEPDRVPSEAFEGFGLFTVYSTDNPVILRADGEPYYDNVKKLEATDVRLAAKLKKDVVVDDYYQERMPYGTLTDMASGFRYALHFNEASPNNWYFYSADGVDLSDLTGKRVMWNLFTYPDVLVGAAKVPELSELSKTIADDEIVPYVRIRHSSDDYERIGRIDIYFARKNNLSKPVALGDGTVRVTIRNGWFGRSWPFSDFDKPVRNTIDYNADEGELRELRVEYEKDGASYTWNFTPMFGAHSGIEWGKLELSAQPLTISAGESVDIEIKLPGMVDLEDDFDDGALSVQSGNENVLAADDFVFTQGSGSWNGLTWNEEKSSWTFKLLGNAPGRTAITLNIPGIGTYYREIHVVDASGSMNLTSTTDAHGLFLVAGRVSSRARMLNGKPFYPSAEDSGTDFELHGDYSGRGNLGITRGTVSEVHPIRGLWSASGVRFNTADSDDNTEQPRLTVELDAVDEYSAWVEFDDPNLNIAEIPLASLLSADYMTTSEQLETFAPYFEMKHDEYMNVVSLDWSFVNPATGEKVTPEVSDVNINWESVEGTSGTIEFHDAWYVNFSYTYKEVRYDWDFYMMDYNSYGDYYVSQVPAGASFDVTVNIYNSADLEAIDVNIWDEDILSADPVHFVPADEISFDLFGLKEGRTTLALVFARNWDGMTSYDKYVMSGRDITVGETEEQEASSGELSAAFVYRSEALIAEGLPVYYDENDSKTITLELEREGTMSANEFYGNMDSLNGTLHLWSGDTEVLSFDLMPDGEYDWDPVLGGVYHVQYNAGFDIDGLTRVSWEFPSSLVEDGSAEVPTVVRSTSEQLASYKPYVKLTREGLNIASAEWYFVDANNKQTSPEGIDDVQIRVYREMMDNIRAEGTEGSVEVDTPDIFVYRIRVDFMQDGVLYKWNFRPVNNPDNYPSAEDVITWDVASPDLPLIMRVGESKTITLSASNIENPSAFVGNTALVTMETTGTSGNSVTVKLTAVAAGMTSIVLSDGGTITWPREIWIADADGVVPHLTEDIDAFVEELTGNTEVWYDYSADETDDDNTGGTTEQESPYKTGEPAAVLNGLSVYPRFVVPTDPSPDAYLAAWDEIDANNSSYGALMFEDKADILASRDARAEFMTLSHDLIGRKPAQLLALVLPEFIANESGFYTLRVPTDHITLEGTKLFMHTNPIVSSTPYNNGGNDTPTPSDTPAPSDTPDTPSTPYSLIYTGDLSTYTDDYSVIISIDVNEAGEAAVILTESDLHYPPQLLAYDIMSTDVGGNISRVRLYGIVSADTLEGGGGGFVEIMMHSPDGEEYPVVWGLRYEFDEQGMTLFDDEGTELEAVNGEEFVNVSVFLSSGRYAPYITAKATSNDITLLEGTVAPVSDDKNSSNTASEDVTPSPLDNNSTNFTPTEPGDSNETPSDSNETPSDSNGGGDTPSPQPNDTTTLTPSQPGFSLENTNIVNTILGLLGQFFSGTTQVVTLPDSAVGNDRTADDLSAEELAQIPSTQTVVFVLPIIVVPSPAVYVFGVDMSRLAAGTPIFMHMMHEPGTASSEFTASDAEDEASVFLDDEGNEITTVPAGGHVNIAAYMEPGGSYAPVITTSTAPSDGSTEPEDNGDGGSVSSSSSSGCDAGVGAFALAVCAFFLRRRTTK